MAGLLSDGELPPVAAVVEPTQPLPQAPTAPAPPALETRRRAGTLRADLQYSRIDEILATGLHAFLTQFLDRVNEIGAHISREFLVPSTH